MMENLLLTTGKELIVDFYMTEDLLDIEVEVTAIAEQDAKTSELATISVQEFNAEVASRYSGSRSDVARMAAGFAGVSANDDSRNDIVIRGNSPSGLLWRLNGIDIPNPSHFGALGATGGPVSMLNNNLLDNSTFITGAFPANYGNVLSGVFDLTMRKGNKDKIEGVAQVSFNGFEAGLEGPLSKKSGASFLLNYRYSVIDLISKLGGNSGGGTGTGNAIPKYQDLSFNMHVPTQKMGTFNIFGLGGNSGIEFLSDLGEEENANLFSGDNENLYYDTYMQTAGITNKHYFNNNSYGKASVSFSRSGVKTRVDTLTTLLAAVPVFRDNSKTDRYRVAYDYKNKFNKKHSLNAGIYLNHFEFNFIDSVRMLDGNFRILRNFEGGADLNQAHAQWQFRANARLTMNLGVFTQYYTQNNTNTIEPRFNMKYNLSPKLTWSFGAGRHSKLQDFQLYLIQTRLEDGRYIETNNDLDFTFSDQLITGIDWSFAPSWKLKSEFYYQRLTKVPVEQEPSSFSALNIGADFNIPSRDSLVNEGTGSNYGIELTLDRSFKNGFYLLSTVSVFKSTYEGSDGITRSTAFDNRYVANLLTGKEFKFNKKYSLAIDTKITTAGGRRYTPINLAESILQEELVLENSRDYELQFDDYFRADLKLTIRQNMKRISQSFSIDIQNLFDTQNVFGQNFNSRTNKIETSYQLGRFPVFDYRLNF